MSPAFAKKTIPEQFADRLLADILENRFGAMLPSVRELVVRYRLNPVSVHRGITLLVRRGVLVNHGPRRRLTIAAMTPREEPCSGRAGAAPCCRPIIFVGADPSEVNSTLMMATHDIQQASRSKGGGCVTIVLAGLDDKAKAVAIRSALIEHKPSHALLLYCDQTTYDLVAPRVDKVALIGGAIQARKAVRLSADLPMLAAAAFEDLIPLGHRRFRLMMLGRPGGVAVRRFLKDFSRKLGVEVEGVFDGQLDMRSMKRALDASLRAGVTAFAFPRPEEYLLGSAYFELAGVQVPADVSTVMLLSGPYDFMRAKQPAHFKIGKDAIISLVLGWFESDENRSEQVTREAMRTYVRGKTVGQAKASK